MKPYTRKDRRGYRNLAASAVAAGVMFLGTAATSASAHTSRSVATGSTSTALALLPAMRSEEDPCGQRLGDLLKDVI